MNQGKMGSETFILFILDIFYPLASFGSKEKNFDYVSIFTTPPAISAKLTEIALFCS